MFDLNKKLKLFRNLGLILITQGTWGAFVATFVEPERIIGIILLWTFVMIGIFLFIISFESVFYRIS